MSPLTEITHIMPMSGCTPRRWPEWLSVSSATVSCERDRVFAMGTFHDINELVGTVAWPVVASGALFMFRRQLKNGMSDLLARLSKAKIGALDHEFEKAFGQIAGTGEPAPPPAEAAKQITEKGDCPRFG